MFCVLVGVCVRSFSLCNCFVTVCVLVCVGVCVRVCFGTVVCVAVLVECFCVRV